VLELDSALEFDAARTEEDFFPALPAAPAVCLIEPREERAEPFLIRTQNLQRRLERLLGPPDATSKRLNLRDFASRIRYRLTGKIQQDSARHVAAWVGIGQIYLQNRGRA
jgi:hypothetical protein